MNLGCIRCRRLAVRLLVLLLVLLFPDSIRTEQVILISVDGLHDSDLEWACRYIPNGNIAMMKRNSVMFRRAFNPIGPPFAGLLKLTAGLGPRSTGVFGDVAYARDLWPPGTSCTGGAPDGPPGTEVLFDERILLNSATGSSTMAINEDLLPINASCKKVYPHSFVRRNNIFEILTSVGLRTAWADIHPGAEMLRGPSGQGLSVLHLPSVAPLPEGGPEERVKAVQERDRLMVDAVVEWLGLQQGDGGDDDDTSMPNLMGCSLYTLHDAQQHSKGGGYEWDGDTPGSTLREALTFIDQQVGRIMQRLREAEVLDTTTVVLTAKHGQVHAEGYVDVAKPTVNASTLSTLLGSKGIKMAHAVTGNVTMVWLANSSQSKDAARVFAVHSGSLQLESVLEGVVLKASYWGGDPGTDGRAPDVVIKSYQSYDQHPDEQYQGLMFWNLGIVRPAAYRKEVQLASVAPTILKLLFVSRKNLGACQEGLRPLPGF